MTNGLDHWLKQATRHSSGDSTLQVRTEIQEHYELSREAALERGATAEAAEQEALTALGDAKAANRQYRRVLLTSAEARLLREGTWESRAVCSHRPARTLLPSLAVAALLAAAVLFRTGTAVAARLLLLAGVGMSQLFIVPFLPVYTPARSRVVRYVKLGCAGGDAATSFRP